MSGTLIELANHASVIGGLISLGAFALFLLPWREQELTETATAVREGWRLLDRALRTEAASVSEFEAATTVSEPAVAVEAA